MLKIEKRVIGQKVASLAAANEPAPKQPDVDPRFMRIDRREEGTWESITTKVSFPSSDGQKKLYFSIGFGAVCGTKDGKQVCIERPLEFFVPVGQSSADYQWISSNMRLLSLCARGGTLNKALEDMRQVQSGEAIWYGQNPSGKTLVHTSLVAVLAWSIQDLLRKRGYFNDKFEEADLEVLVTRYERLQAFRSGGDIQPAMSSPIVAQASQATPSQAVVGTCPERACKGDLVLKDGCPTCVDCGYSKCG